MGDGRLGCGGRFFLEGHWGFHFGGWWVCRVFEIDLYGFAKGWGGIYTEKQYGDFVRY